MQPSKTPTFKRQEVPMALVVGANEPVIRALCQAALTAQVMLSECALTEAVDLAAELRPLVLIVPHGVHALDAENLEAVARDIQGELMILAEPFVPSAAIENELIAKMMAARARRTA